MSRKMSALEVKVTLAGLANLPPDDVDGYVVVYAGGSEVIGVMTNGADESTTISILARAIEHRAAAVGKIEDAARTAQ
jgi:hypothetical protein